MTRCPIMLSTFNFIPSHAHVRTQVRVKLRLTVYSLKTQTQDRCVRAFRCNKRGPESTLHGHLSDMPRRLLLLKVKKFQNYKMTSEFIPSTSMQWKKEWSHGVGESEQCTHDWWFWTQCVWGGGRGVRNTAVLGCLRQAALVQKSSGSSVILSCASTGKLKKLDMQPARHVAMCPWVWCKFAIKHNLFRSEVYHYTGSWLVDVWHLLFKLRRGAEQGCPQIL